MDFEDCKKWQEIAERCRWESSDREYIKSRPDIDHMFNADHRFNVSLYRKTEEWKLSAIECKKADDAKFVKQQRDNGHPDIEGLKRKLRDLQDQDDDDVQSTIAMKRHFANMAAEEQRHREELDRRKAAIFAKEIRAAVEQIILEMVEAGILRHG